MAWCPKCKAEYREGYENCVDCNVELVSELQPVPEEVYDNEAFLVSVANDIEAQVIEFLLLSERIPVLKKYKGAGDYLQICMGSTIFGVDLYVPSKLLEEAKVMLNAETELINEDSVSKYEMLDTEIDYQNKPHIVTWVFTSIKVMAIILIVCALCYYAFDILVLSRVHMKKPVIYLYPTIEQKVSVLLDYNGNLTCTYPKYNGGWSVLATPNGNLINLKDSKEYSYLFWEGESNNVNWDLSKGFVVEGNDTADFLQRKLSEIGLLPKEYNDFISYWLPEMEQNKYNLIAFQGDQYTENAQLIINPKPNSILRVFMAYKPLTYRVNIKEQTFNQFERDGFTVVEWGGARVK